MFKKIVNALFAFFFCIFFYVHLPFFIYLINASSLHRNLRKLFEELRINLDLKFLEFLSTLYHWEETSTRCMCSLSLFYIF